LHETKDGGALIVPVAFAVTFMRALRGGLTSKTDDIAEEEPVKPKAKVQGA
jgi:hypothetical protein